jgi:deoxyhypusine monooxygenase
MPSMLWLKVRMDDDVPPFFLLLLIPHSVFNSGLKEDDSALLKHEIAYALGQMQDPYAVPHLIQVLEDSSEDSMVRHEAGESLGAIAVPEVIPILEKYSKDPTPEIAETCQLALERILFLQSQQKKDEETSSSSSSFTQYDSVDPAPPEPTVDVSKLRRQLLDTTLPLFKRYRAMFSLRNIGGKEAVDALVDGFGDSSTLFRHEIAYVLGQMQDAHSAEGLRKVLERYSALSSSRFFF